MTESVFDVPDDEEAPSSSTSLKSFHMVKTYGRHKTFRQIRRLSISLTSPPLPSSTTTGTSLSKGTGTTATPLSQLFKKYNGETDVLNTKPLPSYSRPLPFQERTTTSSSTLKPVIPLASSGDIFDVPEWNTGSKPTTKRTSQTKKKPTLYVSPLEKSLEAQMYQSTPPTDSEDKASTFSPPMPGLPSPKSPLTEISLQGSKDASLLTVLELSDIKEESCVSSLLQPVEKSLITPIDEAQEIPSGLAFETVDDRADASNSEQVTELLEQLQVTEPVPEGPWCSSILAACEQDSPLSFSSWLSTLQSVICTWPLNFNDESSLSLELSIRIW